MWLMTILTRWSTLILLVAAILAPAVRAQPSPDISGRWEGTLAAGGASLRLLLDVTRTPDGIFLGVLTSVDQGNARIPLDVVEVRGSAVRLEARAANGTFEGTFSADGTRISGTWSQGIPLPLVLSRVTPDGASQSTSASPASGTTKPPANPNALGLPLELRVPAPPIPFSGNHETHLAYELHATNFGPADVSLRRLEVLSGETPLASFEGAELNGLLRPVGAAPPGAATAGPADFRTIGSGRRSVAFLWLSLEKGAASPTRLRHRITTDAGTLEAPAVDVPKGAAATIGPPLRGGPWMAGNGPANASGHRRALLALGGRAAIAQRFAIDWVKINPQGRTFDGDAKENAAYAAYGQEAIAVADGTVAASKDGIPENVPGITSRAVPITLETIGGNFVVLDLGGGRYAFYAHLQPGSLRVKPGEKVNRGRVLGLVGNSGNSTEPHLHFHVSDGPDHLASEGLPYVLDGFEVAAGPAGFERRAGELPMNNAVVRFLDAR
jgi:murein DD-endopeptidase MepM/ murein hydrolase activator NlpD